MPLLSVRPSITFSAAVHPHFLASTIIYGFYNNTLSLLLTDGDNELMMMTMIFADNTTTIVVSSVVGAVTLMAVLFLFQFIR